MYCMKCGCQLADEARFCNECGAAVDRRYVPGMPAEARVVYGAGPRAPWDEGSFQDPAPVPAVTAVPYEPAPAVRSRRGRKPAVTLAFSLLCLALVLLFEVLGVLLGVAVHADEGTAGTVGGAVGAVVAILILGGKRLLAPDAEALKEALRQGWWAIAVSVALMVFDLVTSIAYGELQVVSDWPLQLLNTLVLCAAIGIVEESVFRGILFEGILDVSGKTKRGMVIAAVVTSVLFGVAHIDFTTPDLLDPLNLLQALLKVLQTGTYGFFLAALVLHTKSLWGAALIHGLDDFILLFTSAVLLGQGTDVDYVTSGEEGIYVAILYLVMIALYLPLVLKGVKMLRQAPAPDQGEFHRE